MSDLRAAGFIMLAHTITWTIGLVWIYFNAVTCHNSPLQANFFINDRCYTLGELMDKAIVISRHPLTSRPQTAVIVLSNRGYTVCVVPASLDIVVGQELVRVDDRHSAWRLTGSDKLFPANITGIMTKMEAEESLKHILSL